MIYIRVNKLFVSIVVILSIPLISFLLWYFKPKKPMEILVMNKSVSSVTRSENKAAFWLLKYNRFVRDNGNTYNHKKDYYGFFPLKPYRNAEYALKGINMNDIDSLVQHYDMAWFIDTYGLSLGDWYGNSSQDTYSRMLYGGLNHNDYLFIKEMIRKNKLVISEFNFFASPTVEFVRSKAEKLLDIYWSGWTGMYYDNLDYKLNPDLPGWLIDEYNKQNDELWPYTKSGIVLVNSDNCVVVLENETHLDIEVPLIITPGYLAASFRVSEFVHFPHRFDISYASDTTNVISYYELSVNPKGESLLNSHNIPSRFPAVTGNMDNCHFYYLAGSFSDYDIKMISSVLQGVRSLDYIMYDDKVGTKGDFFREYYYPFLTTVISDYYNIKKITLNNIAESQ